MQLVLTRAPHATQIGLRPWHGITRRGCVRERALWRRWRPRRRVGPSEPDDALHGALVFESELFHLLALRSLEHICARREIETIMVGPASQPEISSVQASAWLTRESIRCDLLATALECGSEVADLPTDTKPGPQSGFG